MRGPFGGDLSQSHWVVDLRREGFTPQPTGFKVTRYFQFPDRDTAKRAEAERLARAYAARIEAVTGITMFIAEGCFL